MHSTYFEHPNGQLVTLGSTVSPDRLRIDYAAASFAVAVALGFLGKCTEIDFFN